MREIEFRGKPTENNTTYFSKDDFVYGLLLKDDDKYYICLGVNEHIDRDDYEVYMIEVIPDTIGQYTGLKDKNGKKIFEGDIVRYTDIVTEYEENTRPYSYKDIFEGEVTYDYDSFWINDRQLYQIAAYDDEFDPEMEVIGNIYDNPELLKEEL